MKRFLSSIALDSGVVSALTFSNISAEDLPAAAVPFPLYVQGSNIAALKVEQPGVFSNTLVVDTTNGRLGIGAVPGAGVFLNFVGYQPAQVGSGTGTTGGSVSILSGTGGVTLGAAAKCGAGGSFSLASGAGGTGTFDGVKGGNGGSVTITAGAGGNTNFSTTGNNTTGNGGNLTISAGSAPAVLVTTPGNNQAGTAGKTTITGGNGGSAKNSAADVPSAGGDVIIIGGQGGTDTAGSAIGGGSVYITGGLDGAGSSAIGGGVFISVNNSAPSATLGRIELNNGTASIVIVDGTGVGFFGTAGVAQQTSAALTNNVTSGGSNDTIADFTNLTVYATDAAAIRNDIYQLARKLKQVVDALRAYGLLS